jgi:uridine kinase
MNFHLCSKNTAPDNLLKNGYLMEIVNPQIKQVTPRDTVEIYLPDGRVFVGPRGTSAGSFLASLPEAASISTVGAIVNGELRELTFPITMDARVEPVQMADSDGSLIYRRSLTFLLSAAFEQLFPDGFLEVDHSVTSGGYFCKVYRPETFSGEDVARLEAKMRDLVNADLPFEREEVPLSEAIAYFTQKNEKDKLRLLKYRQKPHLVLYSLQDYRDYHHGYMVPSTGYLKLFSLVNLPGPGFILQYPRRRDPNILQPMPDTTKLLETFQQYGSWLDRLGIDSVGALNDAIQAGRIREIILVSEALHEQKIAEIARKIVEKSKTNRIVLIAGPSSSGKTTFSKRLSVQLLAQGVSPVPIEMDSYFVDRENTPKDENGEFDFEALAALDTHHLSQQLADMISGREVQVPRYNFRLGKGEPGDVVKLAKDQIVILEGIHGLDPNLLPDIPSENTFRIYVSTLTQLNLDHYNRISTTDTRLLRRIVRDARERGYSAQQTIQRWQSVRRGEKLYIFPYQENADEMFNSALVYDLLALKPLAEPLLRQVVNGTPEHIEAKRLLSILEWLLPVDVDLIPDNSILREFIGSSILQDFKVWENR